MLTLRDRHRAGSARAAAGRHAHALRQRAGADRLHRWRGRVHRDQPAAGVSRASRSRAIARDLWGCSRRRLRAVRPAPPAALARRRPLDHGRALAADARHGARAAAPRAPRRPPAAGAVRGGRAGDDRWCVALGLDRRRRGRITCSVVRDIEPLTRHLPRVAPAAASTSRLLRALAGPAFAIGLMGSVEAIAIGKMLAARAGHRFDASRQLIGEGFCNLGAALVGGFASSGSFSRTAVNFEAGAVTRVSCILSGVLVLVLVFAVRAAGQPDPDRRARRHARAHRPEAGRRGAAARRCSAPRPAIASCC